MAMPASNSGTDIASPAMDEVIKADALALSSQLQALREKLFPPEANKTLRRFSSGEAARLIGVTDSYLRHLASAGEGPDVTRTAQGRLSYSLDQIHNLRSHLAKAKPAYLPNRMRAEHLQTIAVTNFKGRVRKDDVRGSLGSVFRAAWVSSARSRPRSSSLYVSVVWLSARV